MSHLHQQNKKSSDALHCVSNLCCQSFNSSRPGGCVVVSHCVFNLHLPDNNDIKYFSCIFWLCIFCEVSVKIACIIFNWVGWFFPYYLEGNLYISWLLVLLSDTCFVNIFIQTVGFLFIFLKQKLLIFTKPSLSVFCGYCFLYPIYEYKIVQSVGKQFDSVSRVKHKPAMWSGHSTPRHVLKRVRYFLIISSKSFMVFSLVKNSLKNFWMNILYDVR